MSRSIGHDICLTRHAKELAASIKLVAWQRLDNQDARVAYYIAKCPECKLSVYTRVVVTAEQELRFRGDLQQFLNDSLRNAYDRLLAELEPHQLHVVAELGEHPGESGGAPVRLEFASEPIRKLS